jgi:DNA-binding NarL/FixJ family response regulator
MLEGKAPRLELIVAGARNNEIAERLAITVGTVKSLVIEILAKLGVLNRSRRSCSTAARRVQ